MEFGIAASLSGDERMLRARGGFIDATVIIGKGVW
jgi:hypothetical protein